MHTRAPFTPTRRHFLQAAAAASATGLGVGHAHAGPAGSSQYSAARYAMDLGGDSFHWLRSVTLPGYTLEGESYELGGFRASHVVSGPNPLLDWILSVPRRQADVRPGAVLVTDANDRVKRRVEWTGGRLTQVVLPVLAANAGKRQFVIDFAWDAAGVEHVPGSDAKIPVPLDGKSKSWMTSYYRVSGLPGENEYVTSIALPTITMKSGGEKKSKPVIAVGDVTLEFSARSRDTLLPHVRQVVADGKLTEGEFLDLSIEILDQSATKTQGTVRLYGCGLRSYTEEPYESGQESSATFTLKLSVGRVDLEI